MLVKEGGHPLGKAEGVPAWGNTRWGVIWIAFLIQSTAAMGYLGYSPLLPFLKSDLGLTGTQVGLFGTLMSVGIIAGSIPLGRLGDLMETRIFQVLGLILLGLTNLIFALNSSYFLLLLLVFLVGLGYSPTTPLTNKLIIAHHPARVLGVGLGIKQMGVTLGWALVALALPFLAVATHWRTAFAVLGVWVLLASVLVYLLYPGTRETMAARTTGANHRSMKSILADRRILFVSSIGAIFIGFEISVLVFLMLYLQASWAIPVTLAGVIMAGGHVGATLGRFAWGVVGDKYFRHDRKAVIAIIGVCSAVGGFILALGPDVLTMSMLLAMVAVLGFTILAWNGAFAVLVTELAGKENAGAVSGYAQSITVLGSLVVPPVFGYLIDAFSYDMAWLFFAFTMLAASVVLYAVKVDPGANRA